MILPDDIYTSRHALLDWLDKNGPAGAPGERLLMQSESGAHECVVIRKRDGKFRLDKPVSAVKRDYHAERIRTPRQRGAGKAKRLLDGLLDEPTDE